MFARIFGASVGTAAKGIAEGVSTVWGTVKGSQVERDQHTHKEQIAVLEQFASEFAGRPPATKWDSFVDGLNRLPRPVITFSIIGIFVFAFIDPPKFTQYMLALQIVPDELWMMWLTLLAFWFGGRLVSEDIRKPRITPEQIKLAKDIIGQRRPAAVSPDIIAPNPPVVTLPDTLPDIPPSPDGEDAIDSMIRDLIKREGGYSDRATDRGGPTKYGITMSTLCAWRGTEVTKTDVRRLTQEEAHKIYRKEFYLAPGIYNLPPKLQPHVFDICVNSGPRNAIRLLQRAVNMLGPELIEDGIMGPKTLQACQSLNDSAINNALVSVRLGFYEDIVKNDPSQVEYIKGWRARARLFIS